MNKILFILLCTLCNFNIYSQNFDYLTSLRTYWNYRYHLIGDHINTSQHFPSDCNYLEPTGIGEPGLSVLGTDPGMSLPVDHIETYNQVAPPLETTGSNREGVLAGAPYRGADGTSPPGTCYDGTNTPMGWGSTNWTLLPSYPAFANGNGCHGQLDDFATVINYPGPFGGLVMFSSESPHTLAMYIMVLAMEWQLLYSNNKSTIETDDELFDAVSALSGNSLTQKLVIQ